MIDWQTAVLTSIPWAILAGILVYLIKNPEKVEKWASIISRALSFASYRLEKSGVAKDIQADINSFAENLNSQAKASLLPYGVKVKWITNTTREAFVKDGKVIIKMQHHENQAKNFLYALMEWANKAVIPQSRHLIDKTILRAVDFTFVNKILNEKKRHDVRQIFLDEVYEKEATEGSLLKRYCSIFDKLDKNGLFVGVALPEFNSLNSRFGLMMPNETIRSDTIGFVNMLEKLSRKPHGEDISPDYVGENIKCSIVLIARQDTYLTQGLSPYLSYINQCCSQGIRSMYVCGIGDPNAFIIRKIRDAYVESKRISIVSEIVLPLNDYKALIVHLECKQNFD